MLKQSPYEQNRSIKTRKRKKQNCNKKHADNNYYNRKTQVKIMPQSKNTYLDVLKLNLE